MAQLLIDKLTQEVDAKARNLIQMVSCTTCQMTMWHISPQCFVHEDGKIYCESCLPPTDDERIEYWRTHQIEFVSRIRYAWSLSVWVDMYEMSPDEMAKYMAVVQEVQAKCFPDALPVARATKVYQFADILNPQRNKSKRPHRLFS